MNRFLYLGIVFFAASACSTPELENMQEYLVFINDVNNGLVKTKSVNGISLKVKYQPPLLLATNELGNEDKHNLKTLLRNYENTHSFLLTLGPDIENGGDIVYKGVKEFKEYKQRIEDLHFNIEENVYLEINKKRYKAVLVNMESIYGMKESRDITIVFAPQQKEDETFYNAEELDFVFEDQYFQTGINKFRFYRKEINQSLVPNDLKEYIES